MFTKVRKEDKVAKRRAMGATVRAMAGKVDRISPALDGAADAIMATGGVAARTASRDRGENPHVRDMNAVIASKREATAAMIERGAARFVPLGTVVAAIEHVAAAGDADRSLRPLVQSLKRIAADDAAKKYWSEYFGDYGAQMTREVKEVLKSAGYTVGQLEAERKRMASNYGTACGAVLMLDIAIED